jgi:hypothetical protein
VLHLQGKDIDRTLETIFNAQLPECIVTYKTSFPRGASFANFQTCKRRTMPVVVVGVTRRLIYKSSNG